MRYWWVNHKQTGRREIANALLWSPKHKKGGARSQYYENMERARAGDLVLSYIDGKVGHVGRVVARATTEPKPHAYGPAGENWNDVGWGLRVEWHPLTLSVPAKPLYAELKDLLPSSHSPIDKTGGGNRGAYFSEIDEGLFRFFVDRGGGDAGQLLSPATSTVAAEIVASSSSSERVNEGHDIFQADDSPSIYVYMINLLPTLRAFGGSATSDEVCDWYVKQGIARPTDVSKIQKQGETRFRKEVRFARLALAKAGLLSGNDPGQWRLSPLGWTTDLDLESARAIASRRAVDLTDRQIQRQEARIDLSDVLTLPRPTRGPTPVAWEGVVRRPLATDAVTYVMRFGESSIWKIGHTSNVTGRLAELNRHVPVEFLKCRWQLVRERRWSDPRLAYEMEQRVLKELVGHRTTGERVSCTDEELSAAWDRVIT